MRKNRFRPSTLSSVKNGVSTITDVTVDTLVYLRPVLKAFCVLTLAMGIIWGVLDAAKHSPYFKITAVRVENAHRVSRADIMSAIEINEETNYFKFDPLKARKRLLEHDWVADATVTTHLPNHITVRIQERRPVAVVALGSLYLVDAEGKVFTKTNGLDTLPNLVITGLNKEDLNAEPDKFKAKVRTALALERLYRQNEVSSYRHLDSIHFGVSGRWELMLGSTHVILGSDRFEQRLSYLADVLRTLSRRKVGAEYIMLAPELNRAIVKERVLEPKTTELSLRTNADRGETR
jgi:cell division septal protein FtsQ